ncbi:MAG: Gfo/Idh/MocA family oxidoreductase [Sediminibacterium sp.]|nr:Gfo/Idh/MocA family oxidoreductase [Sediminibacterium sp.]
MRKKIGLVGVGYLGKIHLKLLLELAEWELVGIYDINQQLSLEIANQYNITHFPSLDKLIEAVDAVDVVTPSSTHFEIARQAIFKGKDIFIEKPVTSTIEEAVQLQQLALEGGVCIQVGHVERFNPAFAAALPYIKRPRFIEIHRLASYNPRGTDVSVTLDLMLHDLDLLLHVVKANIRKISASGAGIISASPDIVNARIEFDNGCVANLTTNRMAFKNVRKFRIFDEDCFISINLLDKQTQVMRIKDAKPGSGNITYQTPPNQSDKEIVIEHPIILPTNAIKQELLTFYNSVANNKKVAVSISEAISVLKLAFDIDEKTKN